MNIAIAITLFRRPEYTQQVLDALLECYGIEDIPVFLSHDWSFAFDRSCQAVAEVAHRFQQRHKGPSEYFVHHSKLGIDLNKLFVIPKAFESGADFVVFIEDDTVPARDLIRFMQSMAAAHVDHKDIWSVCGYNHLSEVEFGQARQMPYAVGVSRGFNPWLWGTWRDRWQEFYGDGGDRYKADTKHEANGLFDHWLSKKDRLFVLPILPRTRLIGELMAEHTTPADWEREHNEFGAWDLELPDVPVWPTIAGPSYLIHAGTAGIENEFA